MAGLSKGVRGGTITGEPLCPTCRYCFRIQGKGETQSLIKCQRIDATLSFEAFECSQYDDKRHPSLYDMERVAWILMSDAQTKKIGFLSQEELRKRGISYEGIPAQPCR